jgi:cytochrome c peroxidase
MQAIQAYEATLIPDQTPLDKFLAGNTGALTSAQKRGWDLFRGDGQCIQCHAGSVLSDATVTFAATNGLFNSDGGDQGFHNIGVRPTSEDLGRGGTGPNGVKWSQSGSNFDNGAFKTPALRNLKLTRPYMHNGGIATIAEVVEFYKDRGFFENAEQSAIMHQVNISGGLRSALTDFLTNALTDCRTEKQRAPFDHPSLPLPNGTSLTAVGAAGVGSCP